MIHRLVAVAPVLAVLGLAACDDMEQQAVEPEIEQEAPQTGAVPPAVREEGGVIVEPEEGVIQEDGAPPMQER